MGSRLNIYWTCKVCGTHVPGERLLCPRCARLPESLEATGTEGEDSRGKGTEVPTDRKMSPPAYLESGAEAQRIFCVHCGGQIFGDASYCNHCGQTIVRPSPSHLERGLFAQFQETAASPRARHFPSGKVTVVAVLVVLAAGLALAGILRGKGYVLRATEVFQRNSKADEGAKNALKSMDLERKKVSDEVVLLRLTNVTRDKFKDPESVEFRGLQLVHTDEEKDKDGNYVSKYTLCGEVNAKNSFGGYAGYRLFYAFTYINIQIQKAPVRKLTEEEIKRIREHRQDLKVLFGNENGDIVDIEPREEGRKHIRFLSDFADIDCKKDDK